MCKVTGLDYKVFEFFYRREETTWLKLEWYSTSATQVLRHN